MKVMKIASSRRKLCKYREYYYVVTIVKYVCGEQVRNHDK
jgi:hypothetical protein